MSENKNAVKTRCRVKKSNPFDELQELIRDMNIPEHRYSNIKWIDHNIESLNADHPELNRALELLDTLMFRKKVKKNGS